MINHAPKSFPGSNNCDTDKTNSKDQGNILHNNFQYYIVILINIKGPEYDAQSSKNPCSRFQVNGKIGQMNAMKCSNINKNHISSALIWRPLLPQCSMFSNLSQVLVLMTLALDYR